MHYQLFSGKTFFTLSIILMLFIRCGTEKASEIEEKTPDIQKKRISYVNPMIGTKGNGGKHPSTGNVHPGAVLPWGMVAVSSQTFDFTKMNLATGYRADQDRIFGFSCINFSGVGCPAGGSIPFKFSSRSFNGEYSGSTFSEQVASPGYYSVNLDDENIHVSATTTTRSAILKVDLPEGEGNIYLDLTAQQGHIKGGEIQNFSETNATGYQLEGYFCGAKNKSNVFFNLELDKKADSVYLKYQNKSTKEFQQNLDDKPSGIVYVYSNEKPTTIYVKVGVSYVSVENAKENLSIEQKNMDFETIKNSAANQWEEALSRIDVETDNEEQKVIFYTSLYHSLLMPMTFSDQNGEYVKMGGEEIGIADYTRYTAFSLWDTYRTVHPLLTLVYPERQLDMVKSMIGMYDESGWLPKWPVFNFEPDLMVGDPGPIVVADTYMKGIRQFDIDKAYEAFSKHADQVDGNLKRRGLEEYIRLGYISMDGPFGDVSNFQWDNGIVWGSVSTTMEINLSDYGIAQVARSLNKHKDYKRYLDRSMSFMNYFNDKTHLFQPKNKNGSWYEPFDPEQDLWDKMNFNLRGGPGFVEGNSYQYTFSIPHGIDSLKTRMGEEGFLKKLNTIFDKGYFDMTNEPGLGFPFFYNFTTERNTKTAETVHGLITKHFTNTPNGIPGNDDAGTMSAWVVFAMMGIYPYLPGSTEYLVTTPMMKKATIKLNPDFYPDASLEIARYGNSTDEIKKIELNKSAIGGSYIVHHKELTSGNVELIVKTE